MQPLIYDFKRYGIICTIIVHKISESIDYQTGLKTRDNIVKKIRRAVIFPTNNVRTKQYVLMAQAFKYGAQFDTKINQILIDVSELSGFDIEIGDYIVIFGYTEKWEIFAIDKLETALIISCKAVEGAKREAVIPISIENHVVTTQTIGTT